jgi:hypothetical protein
LRITQTGPDRKDSGAEHRIPRSLSTDISIPSNDEEKPCQPSQRRLEDCSATIEPLIEDCDYLEFYKDCRLGQGENWAFKQGSIAVCLGPAYTELVHEKPEDEFELIYGDVYVVLRMYADRWAFCARVSFKDPVQTLEVGRATSDGASPTAFSNLGFLPLCSVTLAANFSAFHKRRVGQGERYLESSACPSDGLRVTPPKRASSLVDSKERIFGRSSPGFLLPFSVFEICNSFHEVSDGSEPENRYGIHQSAIHKTSTKTRQASDSQEGGSQAQNTAPNAELSVAQSRKRRPFSKMWNKLKFKSES